MNGHWPIYLFLVSGFVVIFENLDDILWSDRLFLKRCKYDAKCVFGARGYSKHPLPFEKFNTKWLPVNYENCYLERIEENVVNTTDLAHGAVIKSGYSGHPVGVILDTACDLKDNCTNIFHSMVLSPEIYCDTLLTNTAELIHSKFVIFNTAESSDIVPRTRWFWGARAAVWGVTEDEFLGRGTRNTTTFVSTLYRAHQPRSWKSIPHDRWVENVSPSHVAMLMAEKVKINTKTIEGRGGVLVALRDKTRKIKSIDGHDFVKRFCAIMRLMNINVTVAVIGDETPWIEQYRLFSEAGIVVSVHGAQLTNIAWMKRGSTVIEISLRPGWCHNPYTERTTIERLLPDWLVCGTYSKADYSIFARLLGHSHYIYDPVGISKPFKRVGEKSINPITVENVMVNTTDLALVVAMASTKNT
jgi:hypothetical protein